MSAARMTTRFVLAPLITLLIGLVLLRPSLTLRTWLGMLLIGAGVGWLLLAAEVEPEESALPLNLNRQ